MRARLGPQRKANGDENAMSRHVRQSSSITGGAARVAVPSAKVAVLQRQALNEVTTTAVNRKVRTRYPSYSWRSDSVGLCHLWPGEGFTHHAHCCSSSVFVAFRGHVQWSFVGLGCGLRSRLDLVRSSGKTGDVASVVARSEPCRCHRLCVALRPKKQRRWLQEPLRQRLTCLVLWLGRRT